MGNIYCLVPILNEEENIPTLLKNWQAFQQAVPDDRVCPVVIDDGSTDRSVPLLKEHGQNLKVEVLSHEANRGPGYAFGTGFQYLAEKLTDGDFVATMEGDNTSRLETLIVMLERSRREGIDVVLASPYAFGGGIANTSVMRVILSHGANGFLRGVLGVHGIHTMSSFFRVHRAGAIQRLQEQYGPRILVHDGFEGMVEMVIKITRMNMTVSEVPMRLDVGLRKGKSKMKILKTIFGYFLLWISQRKWPNIAPRYVELQ